MIEQEIRRNAQKLAQTRYCRETTDGGITLTAGLVRYEICPERIADAPAFAETWSGLVEKRWFTPEVAADFVNVVTARWMARAHGWI